MLHKGPHQAPPKDHSCRRGLCVCVCVCEALNKTSIFHLTAETKGFLGPADDFTHLHVTSCYTLKERCMRVCVGLGVCVHFTACFISDTDRWGCSEIRIPPNSDIVLPCHTPERTRGHRSEKTGFTRIFGFSSVPWKQIIVTSPTSPVRVL